MKSLFFAKLFLVPFVFAAGSTVASAHRGRMHDAIQRLEPGSEARTKMADAAQKLTDCLKSNRPATECHDEFHQNCREASPDICPAMGKGYRGKRTAGLSREELREKRKLAAPDADRQRSASPETRDTSPEATVEEDH